MTKKLFLTILGVSLSAFISSLALAEPTFADAGPGYKPSGGSCRGGDKGDRWVDTCFGLSWQYYEYHGTKDVKVEGTNSGNVKGGTISGSCGAVGGYWRLGFEQYKIGSSASKDTSTGKQIGIGQLGTLKPIGGDYRYYYSPTKSSREYGDKTMSNVKADFQKLSDYEVAHGLTDKPYTRGYKWSSGSKLGWFCFGELITKDDPDPEPEPGPDPDPEPTPTSSVTFASTSSVSILGGNSATSSSDGRANVTQEVKAGSKVTISFWHDLQSAGTKVANDASVKTNWSVTSSGVAMSPSPASGGWQPTTVPSSAPKISQTTNLVVTVPASGQIEVCQTINYSPKNIPNSGTSGSSKACAVLMALPPSSITGGGSGSGTVISEVRNLTNTAASRNQQWTTAGYTFDKIALTPGSASGSKQVTQPSASQSTEKTQNWPNVKPNGWIYAKPGDKIEFRHTVDKTGWWNLKADSAHNDLANTRDNCNLTATPTRSNSGVPSNCTGVNVGAKSVTYSPSGGSTSAGGYTVNKKTVSVKDVGTNGTAGGNIPYTLRQDILNASPTWAYKSGLHCHNAHSLLDYCYDYDYSSVTTGGQGSSYALVKVPYNYTTTPGTSVTPPSSNPDCSYPNGCTGSNVPTNQKGWPNYGIAYGGEEYSFKNTITTNPRPNTEVSTTPYATASKPSVYEVVSFVVKDSTTNKPGGSGQGNYSSSAPAKGSSCSHYTSPLNEGTPLRPCVAVDYSGVSLNPDGDLNETKKLKPDNSAQTLESLSHDLIVDDLPIGSKFCVAISVWPADSHNGETGNDGIAMQNSSGGSWQHGAPYCVTIAKKPTVQFLGAGVYSKGGIVSTQTIKRITPTGFRASSADVGLGSTDPSRRAFGSWAEYEVISSRKPIKNLASGAALGYELNNGGTAPANARPGGFLTTRSVNFQTQNVCSYTKSTIANSDCVTKKTSGDAKIDINDSVALQRIVARYSVDPESTDDSVVYYENDGDATINATNIPAGKTYVYSIKGTATIAGNITYPEGPYADIADLPQAIIIAGDILINENVTKVDAWLVSGQNPENEASTSRGVVDTCPGYTVGGNLSGSVCNKRLDINGPIFAKKLDLKRTAGAEPGYNSINPGEVINLRPDTYLWAYNQSKIFSQAATVTYLRELAPRY